MEKLEEFILNHRDLDAAQMEDNITKVDGYFAISDVVGSHVDDAYETGKSNGRAELIEELILILNNK